ncbi:MAG: hypothetical protein MI754_11655 [Chromatiales bacterium]|nr:hypothetical protein [Chromatiales bacterium]
MNQASFINVDLELSSEKGLSIIAEELKDKIFLLQDEFDGLSYKLAFECSLTEQEPEPVIETLIGLLDSLSTQSKALVKSCSSKIMDIGYDSGEEGVLVNNIPCALLQRITEYEIDLNITVYPVDKDGK